MNNILGNVYKWNIRDKKYVFTVTKILDNDCCEITYKDEFPYKSTGTFGIESLKTECILLCNNQSRLERIISGI